MVEFIYKAISSLYSILAAIILSSWIILTLSSLGADGLRRPKMNKSTITSLVALPSLLTFLACKLIMVVHPDPLHNSLSNEKSIASRRPRKRNTGSLIRWIATAGEATPRGSLVLLLLSAAWLYHMLRSLAMLFLITASLIAVAGTKAINETDIAVNGTAVDPQGQNSTHFELNVTEAKHNLSEALNSIKEDIGIDLETLAGQFSPDTIIWMSLTIWLVSFGLMGYIIAQTVTAFKVISTSPKEALTGVRDEREVVETPKTVEVASDVI